MLYSILAATEFWSAIVGAMVGGGIAYAVQIRALKESREQRAAERKQSQQAQAQSLLFKMIKIHSDHFSIFEFIENSFARASEDGFKGEPWQFVIPIANPPEPVHFSSDEMSMLLGLQNDDVFNEIVAIDTKHNGLISALNILNLERKQLTEKIGGGVANGLVVTSVFSEQKVMELSPYIITVNELIHHVHSAARDHHRESEQALIKLNDIFREKLDLKHKLTFKQRQNLSTKAASEKS